MALNGVSHYEHVSYNTELLLFAPIGIGGRGCLMPTIDDIMETVLYSINIYILGKPLFSTTFVNPSFPFKIGVMAFQWHVRCFS